jgi:hypothetical protein
MNLETLLFASVICAVIGGAITNSKNRGWREGTILGALLGVIGIIIILFLRTRPQAPIAPIAGWYPDPTNTHIQRYWNGCEWSELPPHTMLPPMPETYEPQARNWADHVRFIATGIRKTR